MLITCPCQSCGQNIEFDAQNLGETHPCPNCTFLTILFDPSVIIAVEDQKEPESPPPVLFRTPTFWDMTFSGMKPAVLWILVALLIFVFAGCLTKGMSFGDSLLMLLPVAVGVAFTFFGVALYFLPFIIAFRRRRKNLNAIFMLNLLLGWTILGWVVAMVWAMLD
jgi:hypothetical protein